MSETKTYFQASLNGDLKFVNEYLKEGGDINVVNKRGSSALMLCLLDNERFETARLLIDKGVDLSLRDKSGWRAFSYAAINGHVKTLKYLVDKGDAYSDEDWKALMFSVTYRNCDTAEIVLALGADVNMNDDKRMTPLMRAVRNSDHEMVKLLIRNEADLDIKDNRGMTALMYACSRANVENVKLLLKKDAKKNIKNDDAQTALDIAKEKSKEKFIELF